MVFHGNDRIYCTFRYDAFTPVPNIPFPILKAVAQQIPSIFLDPFCLIKTTHSHKEGIRLGARRVTFMTSFNIRTPSGSKHVTGSVKTAADLTSSGDL